MNDPDVRQNESARAATPLPPEIDLTVPSVARIYDYALGGKNNFEVDRVTVEALYKSFPGTKPLAVDNRGFLGRGVRYLVEEGIDQLIDVGSGLPTVGNVHEVAHAINPDVRVVYVDIDPIVLAHARALLAGDKTTVIQADAADPESILNHPATRELIDFDKPFAVILAGILHHLPDDRDPLGVVRTFRDRLPSGGYLLISSFLDDDDQRARDMERDLTAAVGTGRFRVWADHLRYFEGLELVEPGLVYANDWRPDENTAVDSDWHTFQTGGLGRKT